MDELNKSIDDAGDSTFETGSDEDETVEITSNILSDYLPGVILEPTEKDGNHHPFRFRVLSSDSVKAIFEESGRKKFWEEDITLPLYLRIKASLIEKRSIERGDVTLIELNDDDEDDYPGLSYSSIINSNTIEEAVTKSLQLMEEIQKPLDEAMAKVEGFLIKELSL